MVRSYFLGSLPYLGVDSGWSNLHMII